MQWNEIALLRAYLRSARSYFEFGAGGTTVLAADLVQGPLCAIDSSNEWLDRVRAELPPSAFDRRLLYADIGPTGQWGHPMDHSDPDKFLNYHERIWDRADAAFDLYLVDGRFRVACFAQIIKRMEKEAVIGFHDYRSRPHYHAVEDIAYPISEERDLTFFVKRTGVSFKQIQKVIDLYRFVPD